MDIRAELKNMMEEKGLTIVFVATAIGVAKSTISMWINGTYKGDNSKIADKVHNFILREKERTIDEDLPIVDISTNLNQMILKMMQINSHKKISMH